MIYEYALGFSLANARANKKQSLILKPEVNLGKQ